MVQTADFGISGWSGTTRAAGGVNLVPPTVPRNLPRASRAPAEDWLSLQATPVAHVVDLMEWDSRTL